MLIRHTAVSILLLLSSAMSVFADLTDQNLKEIDYLIALVERSDCRFVRNGITYKGSEAISHINRKFDYFKEEINDTEAFIDLSATKSEISGNKYTVQCGTGEIEELGKWLHAALNEYRQR